MVEPPKDRPEEGIFVLPGGYCDDAGVTRREVQLTPVTGWEEEYLSTVPAATPSANVITQLLVRCVRRVGDLANVDAPLIRRMLVGDREYLILKLRQMTIGNNLRVILECQYAECGKNMEIGIALDELAIGERPVTSRGFTVELASGGRLEFRLPTGEDQEQLAARAEQPECVNELLSRCILSKGPGMDLDEIGPQIEERMEQLVPQVALELEGKCPECGRDFSSAVDLPAFVLAEFAGERQRLRQEVHFLAWHYHWPESEILAMTRKKRRRYIDLIENELERMNPS
jgi:hypothetical protein